VPGASLDAVQAALASAHPLPSVPAFAAVLATPGATAAAWLHLLTLDFVQAAWVARDAAREGVPRRARAVALALCFMAGPLGLLAHLAMRAIVQRSRRRSGIVILPTAG
jgi:hypothetical protein